MSAEYIIYAMAALLVVAMLIELRTGRIPNWITALPLVLFIVLVAITPDRSPYYAQVALSVAVFAGGLALFAVGGQYRRSM